jgi:hypothetical protein
MVFTVAVAVARPSAVTQPATREGYSCGLAGKLNIYISVTMSNPVTRTMVYMAGTVRPMTKGTGNIMVTNVMTAFDIREGISGRPSGYSCGYGSNTVARSATVAGALLGMAPLTIGRRPNRNRVYAPAGRAIGMAGTHNAARERRLSGRRQVVGSGIREGMGNPPGHVDHPVHMPGRIVKAVISGIDMLMAGLAGGCRREPAMGRSGRREAVTRAATCRGQVIGIIPTRRFVGAADTGCPVTIGIAALQVGCIKHRGHSAGPRKRTELDRARLCAGGTRPGAQEMVQRPGAESVVAFTADVGHIDGCMGRMGKCPVGVYSAARRSAVT